MQNKSAKDLAFDKERVKYQKKIKDLNHLVNQKDIMIAELNIQTSQTEAKMLELQDWVNRLLEYMDIPEEEMRRLIQRQKETDEFIGTINKLFGLPRSFYI